MGGSNKYNSRKELLSGVLIGLGVVANLSAENRYVGALLFSFGLLGTLVFKARLYTGCIGFYEDFTGAELWKMLCLNGVGVLAVEGLATIGKPEIISQIKDSPKFDKSVFQMFTLGALCGMCVYIAVASKKLFTVILAVMIFVISGFEHCIADLPYLVMNLSVENFVKWLAVVVGNGIGSRFLYKLCLVQK